MLQLAGNTKPNDAAAKNQKISRTHGFGISVVPIHMVLFGDLIVSFLSLACSLPVKSPRRRPSGLLQTSSDRICDTLVESDSV
jgi:hypothetical protein